MPLIHHVVAGQGRPPVVFVHGFGCAHSDWDAQVAHLSPRHLTVAVDLRGHGASPGTPDECPVEQHGADVSEVMRRHSSCRRLSWSATAWACRVAVEAVLQAPERTAGVVLVDGSQFAPSMEAALTAAFAMPDGMASLARRWFQEMFTPKSNPAVVAAIQARVGHLPRRISEKMLTDLVRYDVARLTTSLTRAVSVGIELGFPRGSERPSSWRAIRFLEGAMTKPYSADLRVRVVEAVDEGATRHEAAERFGVSVSSAVRWHQAWRHEGTIEAKRYGGSRSPLEDHAEEILAVIEEQPDLTLEETVAVMRKRKIPGSRTALFRFLARHAVTLKKSPSRCRAAAGGCSSRPPALDTRAGLA